MQLVEKALQTAALLHDGQYRRGAARAPYVTHVVSVAWAVERCGDDEVIAAALLHDTVEDTDYTLVELETDFGPRVAQLVATVSEDKSLPRKERKQAYVASLKAGYKEASLISAADMIHNLTSLLEERDTADKAFLRHFFHPERLTEYTPRLEAIKEKLGSDHPAVIELETVYQTYQTLVH